MDKRLTSRLDNIIAMLAEYSRGNFSTRVAVTDEDDVLNTVVAGLNMLGEELENYKNEITKQRSLLQNILSSIDEVIYVRDIHPQNAYISPFSFVSGRAKEIIGISEQELQLDPEKWLNAIHPDDRPRSNEMIKKILLGNEVVFTYRTYHHTRQQYRWIEDRVSPKMNKQGRVTHVYGSARDVTEQQQTTLELNETSQLVTRLITSSDQVFYIIALDQGNPYKNTFTYLSAQVEKTIGYSIEDIRKDPFVWINAMHPDDVMNVKAVTKQMFSSKKPVTRIYRIKHKYTGEYIWLEDYIVPILDSNGWIREFYASARDITARKKAEIEREKLIIELHRRHDELMQFNNIVSHNLRAPVASILGLAQHLQGDMPQDELHETSGYILQAAHAMDTMLHDLNAILSARSTLSEKKENFLLSTIINAVTISLKKEIEDTNATIEVLIDPVADRINSIKSYIQSAVFNLVHNAIKYQSASLPPVITIKAFKNDMRTVISISDNGMGINLKKHGHNLFRLYSRLHTHKEGKGLGLYMTKTQIELLNGHIDVESEEGVGTTFTITL
jgi:PAS domain S-box